jgi:nitroreductase
MNFKETVHKRRSMRVYDTSHQFDHEAVKRSLELAILAPNSSNMQLWEFIRVISPDMKEKVAAICMNQSTAKTASEMVVFVTRQDKFKANAAWNLEQKLKQNDPRGHKRDIEYYGKQMPLFYRYDFLGFSTLFRKIFIGIKAFKKPFMRYTSQNDLQNILHKTCGLAAQTFMLAITAEGYDTCPMEGFDEIRLKKLLNLPSIAAITMVVSCGKGTEQGIYNERLRLPYAEVVREV